MSEDDFDLWERIKKTIKPLSGRETQIDKAQEKKRRNSAPSNVQSPHFEKFLPDKNETKSREIDGSTKRKLKRGQINIDGRIDLHGLNRENAQINLIRFIQSSHAMGHRMVLVITGKGTRGEGVIRKSFPEWLHDNRISHIILDHTAAQPKDGGSGAFYVYLRRKR